MRNVRCESKTVYFYKALRVAMCLLAAGLAGCGGASYTTQKQTVEGYTFTFERPQQAELLKSHDLFVTITDAQGQPVNDATVFFDTAMPSMPMNVNQPLADPPQNGRYRVNTVFTMIGDWRVVVHAKIGGKDYAATFDQPVQQQSRTRGNAITSSGG